MATLNLDENHAAYQIRAYKPGMIQINETEYHHSVILSATLLIEPWAPQLATEITAESLAHLYTMKPDILLIGTGSQCVFLSASIYGELINAGIGVEVMSTASACRTYTALTAENRHVVAALIVA